jgi:soluble lytic murein transglycosylase-like protein
MSYKHLYNKIGQQQGINPNLLQAIAKRTTDEHPETFQRTRDGYKYGLMFLSLSGAHTVGFREQPDKLFDPETNITYGARYLRYLLQQNSYNLKKALVAYLHGRYDSRYVRQAENIIDNWKRRLS